MVGHLKERTASSGSLDGRLHFPEFAPTLTRLDNYEMAGKAESDKVMEGPGWS